jgi:hypothetical protein
VDAFDLARRARRKRRKMTRHGTVQDRVEKRFGLWLDQVSCFAMSEAEHTIDRTARFWRECFDDGMSPDQAFKESFIEQDGI